MTEQSKKARRRFHAHVAARAGSLDGILLAAFWQRLLGYCVDLLAAVIIWFPLESLWRRFLLHETDIHIVWDFHEAGNTVVMVPYWGLTNYFGNGQTPGKWVARTRVVSLTGERMGLWQSIERGLGYGAAVLERAILASHTDDQAEGRLARRRPRNRLTYSPQKPPRSPSGAAM